MGGMLVNHKEAFTGLAEDVEIVILANDLQAVALIFPAGKNGLGCWNILCLDWGGLLFYDLW